MRGDGQASSATAEETGVQMTAPLAVSISGLRFRNA